MNDTITVMGGWVDDTSAAVLGANIRVENGSSSAEAMTISGKKSVPLAIGPIHS